MMEEETVSEMLVCNSILPRLFAQEDFIAFSCCGSFESYIILNIIFKCKVFICWTRTRSKTWICPLFLWEKILFFYFNFSIKVHQCEYDGHWYHWTPVLCLMGFTEIENNVSFDKYRHWIFCHNPPLSNQNYNI
jgi:hypothetical protein